jgi:hypothetical protein
MVGGSIKATTNITASGIYGNTGADLTLNPPSGKTVVVNGSVTGASQFSTNNPGNNLALAHMSWISDTPRIRYGGSGAGSANGFRIQGTSDVDKFIVNNDGTITIPGTAITVKGAPSSNTFTQGGIILNNSDIVGVNQLVFNDEMTSDVEAIQFPRTLTTGQTYFDASGNPDYTKFDSFRVNNGTGFVNGKPVFTSDSAVLWEGVYFMFGSQTVTPTKKLSQCPNGWVLVWSDYTSGVENDYDFNYTFIHKNHGAQYSGKGLYAFVGWGYAPSYTTKYVYVFDDKITGNDTNDDDGASTGRANVVLRQVLAF